MNSLDEKRAALRALRVEGDRAFKEGLLVTDCPYRDNRAAHWMQGYLRAANSNVVIKEDDEPAD